MTRWTIAMRQGWLRLEDDSSITCVEAVRVTCFGTTLRGFVVCTSNETMWFEADVVHACECVDRLYEMLAVP